MSDSMGIDKALVELVKISYPDLLKPSLREVGLGLGTILEAAAIPLLRLKYMNIKAKLRFKKRIEKLIEESEQIPAADRAEIPTRIAVQAIDQLSIEDDEDISNLFINLLTKASTKSRASEVHPSFINALKNMSNDEAKLILYLRNEIEIPFIIARLQFTPTEGLDKTQILTGIESRISLQFPQNIPLYFENLTGLGIISRESGSLSDTKRWYEPLFALYEPLRTSIYNQGHTDGKKYDVVYVASYYKVTSYGRLFIEACLKKYPEMKAS